MLSRESKGVEHREACRHTPGFYIELCADAPNEFRPVAYRRKQPGQKKQIARCIWFRVKPTRRQQTASPGAE